MHTAWPDLRVDALIDAYVEWREECEAVESAYERWLGAEHAERAEHAEHAERRFAYFAYRAALDREEKAAAVYQVATTRLVDAAREPSAQRARPNPPGVRRPAPEHPVSRPGS